MRAPSLKLVRNSFIEGHLETGTQEPFVPAGRKQGVGVGVGVDVGAGVDVDAGVGDGVSSS